MSVISKSISALGKLATVGVLLLAFILGMAGVVYMSLSGNELKVPELVGKDFVASEKELAAMGLKIKRRADRVSADPMNTVLEQLPKAGETGKTGQMILVVVSKAGLEGEEPAAPKNLQEDDSEAIEEMISDKPKKRTNSNTSKKKAATTRDVVANSSSSNTSVPNTAKPAETKTDDGEKKEPSEKKEPATGNAPKPPPGTTTKPATDPRPKP